MSKNPLTIRLYLIIYCHFDIELKPISEIVSIKALCLKTDTQQTANHMSYEDLIRDLDSFL